MRALLTAGLIFLFSFPAVAAAPMMQAGLYEVSLQLVLKNMPVQMPVSSFRHCITAQDIIDGNAYASSEKTQDCKISNLRQSIHAVSYDFACSLPGKGRMLGRASGTQHAAGYDIMMNGRFDPPMAGMSEFGQTMHAKRLGACK